MENAIEIRELAHNYGDVQALKPVSLDIAKGELFGFIGPDGAGKTTLFRILTSLMLPDSGSATVIGFDVVRDYQKLRPRLGYMPGQFSLYQDLTVQENLRFFAGLFKTTIDANYHLIADIYDQLKPFKNRLAGKLSGGMKQKLALCCALIHKPDVLFLDEPTTGVDVVSRSEFWQMLKRLKDQEITIVVSTPYMDEASLCDRIALIQKGAVLGINTPQGIINKYDKIIYKVQSSNRQKLSKDIWNFPHTVSAYWFGDSIHWVANDDSQFENLVNYLHKENHSGLKVEKITANIEDCFMDLMHEI